MKTKLAVISLFLVFVMPFTTQAEEQTLPLDAPEVVQTDSPQVVPQDTPQVLQKDAPEVVGGQARRSDDLGQSSTATASQVGTYDQLVAAIRKARGESQARVEQAVAQEKVRENWEIGKLIDEHVLQHKERADYGKQVIARLANDLGTSETELRYMLQFARTYSIYRASDELTWSHYESLLALNDDKERAEVSEVASKEKWPVDRLREEVKKRKAAKNEAPVPAAVEEEFTAKLGKPGTYKMVQMPGNGERETEENKAGNVERGTGNGKGERGTGELVIDLGFSNYYRTSRPLGFKEGAIVESLVVSPDGNSSPSDKIKLSKRTADDLYTYRVSIIEVLDGDTVNAVVDLGFGVRSVQTLRLRGIDAPEMVSKEGKEAKDTLERMLQMPGNGERETEILVNTSKSDKYDRYLADFFIESLYLNQVLVEKGHAVRVRDN